MRKNLIETGHYILMSSVDMSRLGIIKHDLDIEILNSIKPVISEEFCIEEGALIERFKSGDKCFIAREKDSDSYSGILWGRTISCYIRGAGKKLPLKDDEVYLYGVYTKPEARRKHIFNTLFDVFLEHYSAAGFKGFYALVEPRNRIMREILKKAGFNYNSTILHIRFGRLNFSYERHCGTAKKSLEVRMKEPCDYSKI